MCRTAKNFGLQEKKHQHLQPAGKDHELRKRDGVPQKIERYMGHSAVTYEIGVPTGFL